MSRLNALIVSSVLLFCLTKLALAQEIYFNNHTPQSLPIVDTVTLETLNPHVYLKNSSAAVIGAGPAGLLAALVLREKGFEVLVVENRKTFSRFNLVNLKVEAETTFRKLGLAPRFLDPEISKVSKILKIRSLFQVESDEEPELFGLEEFSSLKGPATASYEAKDLDSVFEEPGPYTVRISEFQSFLATEAIKRGVQLIKNVDVKIRGKEKKHIVLLSKGKVKRSLEVHPTLIVLANGAGKNLKEETEYKIFPNHACHNEKWIFGNVAYEQPECSDCRLLDYTDINFTRISNTIFNPVLRVANVAVSLGDTEVPERDSEGRIHLSIAQAQELIEDAARKAFQGSNITSSPEIIVLNTQVVEITNKIAKKMVLGSNLILAGDAAGTSSPLAGLGATLASTAYPYAIEQVATAFLTEDQELRKTSLENYNVLATEYVKKWLKTSNTSKTRILKALESLI